MKIPELLAPAGTFDTLIAVCNAGADAVYCAGTKYGARAYAGNLTDDELIEALTYVHLHGKKLYLTLNTLLKDSEINELYDYLLPLYTNGLDGIIVQDLGVMEYLKLQFPLLPVHISTQAAVMGDDALSFFKENGAQRAVLARELSLKEILMLRNKSDIELEVFVHGALCYSYSGMCFYSSLIGGRSGNRGRCAQPCRMDYTINGKCRDWMSLKDLSALSVLDKLCEIGVDSLKIEGRMKNTEYAAGVTKIYRKYLDLLKNDSNEFKVDNSDIEFLESLYQRRGFSEGYLNKHNGKEMLISEAPKKHIDSFDCKNSDLTKQEKIPVDFYAYFESGSEATLIIIDDNGISITAHSEICQIATSKPLSKETVVEKLSKVNDSLISIRSLNVEITGDIFLPLSALNSLRRLAVDLYIKSVTSVYSRNIPDRINVNKCLNDNDHKEKRISASFLNFNQGEALLKCCSVSRVYFPYDLLRTKLNESLVLIERFKTAKMKVYLSMPEIFRYETKNQFIQDSELYFDIFDGFLLKNIDEMHFMFSYNKEVDCVLDFTLYSFNSFSVEVLKKYYNKITASVELNMNELKKLKLSNGELIVYGRYPMMYTANCLLKNSNKCTKNSEILFYKDRMDYSFFVKCNCDTCYNVIYNSRRTSLLGLNDDLNQINVSYLRFAFTDEKPEDIFMIFDDLKDPKGYTRGHFIRGVQ